MKISLGGLQRRLSSVKEKISKLKYIAIKTRQTNTEGKNGLKV